MFNSICDVMMFNEEGLWHCTKRLASVMNFSVADTDPEQLLKVYEFQIHPFASICRSWASKQIFIVTHSKFTTDSLNNPRSFTPSVPLIVKKKFETWLTSVWFGFGSITDLQNSFVKDYANWI